MLRVIDIVEGTIVDGPGLRTSIYFAGCAHACPGCHNPHTWDFNAGRDMSVDEIMAVVDEADFNVTLTGGDPMYQIDELIPLCRAIRASGRTIWLYTGFTIDEIETNDKLRPIIGEVDAIVDGPFVEALRDIKLRFRGSSNQRIIMTNDIHKS